MVSRVFAVIAEADAEVGPSERATEAPSGRRPRATRPAARSNRAADRGRHAPASAAAAPADPACRAARGARPPAGAAGCAAGHPPRRPPHAPPPGRPPDREASMRARLRSSAAMSPSGVAPFRGGDQLTGDGVGCFRNAKPLAGRDRVEERRRGLERRAGARPRRPWPVPARCPHARPRCGRRAGRRSRTAATPRGRGRAPCRALSAAGRR